MDTKPVAVPLALDYATQPRALRHLFRLFAKIVGSLLLIGFCAVGGFWTANIVAPKTYTAIGFLRLTTVRADPDSATIDAYEARMLGTSYQSIPELRVNAVELKSLLLVTRQIRELRGKSVLKLYVYPETSLIAVELSGPAQVQLQALLESAVDSVLVQQPRLSSSYATLSSQPTWARRPVLRAFGVTPLHWKVLGAGVGSLLGSLILFMYFVRYAKS